MQKRTFLSALFFLTTFSTYADQATQAQFEFCREISGAAEVVMEYRQANRPMAEAYELALTIKHGPMKEMITAIIGDAYKTPLLTTDDEKSALIGAFRDQYFQLCINFDFPSEKHTKQPR